MNLVVAGTTLGWLAAHAAPAPVAWPDLSHPPKGPGTDGRRDVAVVVGIEDYATLADRPGARASAEDWVRWLARTRGVPLSRIHALTDQRARAERIQADVARAAAAVGEGGTLWVVAVGRGTAVSGGTLWAVDADEAGENGAVSVADLVVQLEQSAAAQAVLVVDAGLSVSTHPTVAVLSGGMGDLPVAGGTRPAWSHLVLGSLHGWADTDEDGTVTAAEVAGWSSDGMAAAFPDAPRLPHWTGPDHLLAQGVPLGGPDLLGRALSAGVGVQVHGGPSADLGALAEQAAAMEAVEHAVRAESRAALDASVKDRAGRLAAATAQVQERARTDWAALAPALHSGGERSIQVVEQFVEAYRNVRVELDGHSRSVWVAEVDDARTWLAEAGAALEADPLSAPPEGASAEVTAAWQACAALSDPTGCAVLGQHYELGLGGLPMRPHKAASLYARGCDHLSALSCRYLGVVEASGVGVSRDTAQAREHLGLACDLDDGRGCGQLAVLLRAEAEGAAASARSLDLFERGCGLDDAPSCRLLAESVHDDPARADVLRQKACDLGEALACPADSAASAVVTGTVRFDERGLAEPTFQDGVSAELRADTLQSWEACRAGTDLIACNRLAYAYELGERGLEADIQRAGSLYAHACDQGVAMSCGNVGYLLESGRLGTKDTVGAVQRYEAGCVGGNARSCGNLGVLYDRADGVPGDHYRANTLFLRGCELGSGAACTSLGFNYEQGRGVEPHERRAIEYYERACDKGYARGCGNLGYLLWTGHRRRQDHPRAREYLRMACEQDDARACNNVAIMMGDGVGGPTDLGASNRYMELGCRGGDPNACRNLGLRHKNGSRGVSVDLDAARLYFQQGCTQGSDEACADLEALP